MRCFIAVTPPADVVADIDRFLEPRRTATENSPWRWSRPTTYHLTLAFMADHPGHRIEELIQALDEWAGRHAPLAMSIAGAGGFRGPECAKVLYLGVPGGAAVQLGEWSGQLRALVTHHGGSPDGAGFRAHLTIARAQRAQNAGRLLQALDTYASREFVVPEVVLVESRLATRVHEVLHRAILRG
mgnify:FL=1